MWPRAHILQQAEQLRGSDPDIGDILCGLHDQWNEGANMRPLIIL